MTEQAPVITLRDVTPDNFDAVIDLKVHDDQKHFVASNLYSLAEARVFPERYPLAVYADETPIGFAMYCFEEERQEYWVFRLMIAAEHQGKGYGRAAMRLLIDRMREIKGCRQIFISYEPENDMARKLYTSMGFIITGEIIEEEEVARLDLDETQAGG